MAKRRRGGEDTSNQNPLFLTSECIPTLPYPAALHKGGERYKPHPENLPAHRTSIQDEQELISFQSSQVPDKVGRGGINMGRNIPCSNNARPATTYNGKTSTKPERFAA